jgi:hypothetical protein
MKRKLKLLLNFKETKDSDLSALGYCVANRMTGNEHFPDPGMLIIELHEISRQFQKALTDAWSRDREKVEIKNRVRDLLIKKLKQVGEFVITESKGAEGALLSSGFNFYKPVDEVIIKAPTNFRIKPGPNPGEIIMQVKRVKGARSYLYQWTPNPVTPQSIWQSIPDTRCKKTIESLPLGVDYAFRMAAVGSRNQLLYTNILTRYIS